MVHDQGQLGPQGPQGPPNPAVCRELSRQAGPYQGCEPLQGVGAQVHSQIQVAEDGPAAGREAHRHGARQGEAGGPQALQLQELVGPAELGLQRTQQGAGGLVEGQGHLGLGRRAAGRQLADQPGGVPQNKLEGGPDLGQFRVEPQLLAGERKPGPELAPEGQQTAPAAELQLGQVEAQATPAAIEAQAAAKGQGRRNPRALRWLGLGGRRLGRWPWGLEPLGPSPRPWWLVP